MKKITVLGSGAWGSALSILLLQNGHDVTLYATTHEKERQLKETRKNPALPDIILPNELKYSSDLKEATVSAEVIVFAVASVYTREIAKKLKAYWNPGQFFICASKGIERGTLKMQTDLIADELSGATYGSLSGPSHAEEVARLLPTTCVAAAKEESIAVYIQKLLMNPSFRVYRSTDLLGVELGGSVKNVIALAAGIVDGLGCGDNTKAALITRGIAEITRLGIKMGANAETFAGLSGIGDLIVTCASMHSRNRRAGILIGKGMRAEEAMREIQQVVEGVYSAEAALALAKKYDVEMPIVESVNQILFADKNPRSALDKLMMREAISENGE